MKFKIKRILLMAGLSVSLLFLTNCENKEEINEVEIVEEEKETKKDSTEKEKQEKKEEKEKEKKQQEDEIDREIEEFLTLSDEEKEEILEDVLDYKDVKASSTITHITIDDGRDPHTQTVYSYTNYGDDKKVLSQELMMGEPNTEPVRKTFNNGLEETKGMAGAVEQEERDEPEIYYSYYEILENLKKIKDYLEVEQKKDETILSFDTDDIEVYELLAEDFKIRLNTGVHEMNSSGEYRFNKESNLIHVTQNFSNSLIKIQVRSNFEELDKSYEIPDIQ